MKLRMYMGKISFDSEEENGLGMQWNAGNNIRTDLGNRFRNVSLLHRLAEDIWQSQLYQINSDPQGNWY